MAHDVVLEKKKQLQAENDVVDFVFCASRSFSFAQSNFLILHVFLSGVFHWRSTGYSPHGFSRSEAPTEEQTGGPSAGSLCLLWHLLEGDPQHVRVALALKTCALAGRWGGVAVLRNGSTGAEQKTCNHPQRMAEDGA